MKKQFLIGAALLTSSVAWKCLAQNDLPQPAAMRPPVSQSRVSLAVRSASQMEAADAEVVAAHGAAIARAAAFYDFSLDSSWSYEQAVCPLAPQDIILNYSSRQPHGMSSFSAVVPRQGSVIRIVPLAHDGTAPSVAPWGDHSFHVFNAMTGSSGGVKARDVSVQAPGAAAMYPGDKFVWGLCYVALVNERAVVAHPDSELHVFSATEPTFRLGSEGGSELSFTVRDDSHYYSVWQLEFSPKGLLVRADRDQHMLPTEELDVAKAIAPESSAPSNPGSMSGSVVERPVSGVAVGAHVPAPVSVPASVPLTAEPAASASVAGTVPAASDQGATGSVQALPTHASAASPSAPATQSAAAMGMASAPEARPVRKAKAVKGEWRVVPDGAPLVEHPVPDSAPLVTHPIPQG